MSRALLYALSVLALAVLPPLLGGCGSSAGVVHMSASQDSINGGAEASPTTGADRASVRDPDDHASWYRYAR